MHCLSDEEFGALIENDLAPGRRDHVAACPSCAETWTRIERAEWTIRSAPPRRRSLTRPYIAAIAAALAIGAVAWAMTRPEPAKPLEIATPVKIEPKQEAPKQPEVAPKPEPKKPDVPQITKQMPDVPKPPTPEPKKPEETPTVKTEPPRKPEETPTIKTEPPKKPEETPTVKTEPPKQPDKPVAKPPKAEPEKPSAEALDALANYANVLRRAGRDESAREAAIVGLRQIHEPIILQKLIDVYEQDSSSRVRIAIASGLADYRTSDKALKSLASWLSHDGRNGDLDKTLLESIAEFDGEAVRAFAHRINGHLSSKDMYVACAAMKAAAVGRDLTSVDELIEQMGTFQRDMRSFLAAEDDAGLDSPAVQEIIDKSQRGTLKTSDMRVTRYVNVMPTLNGSLQKMTGQPHKNVRAWKDWWEKNRKSYK